ncbi:hypothetical protein [Streptomyces roseolus]|uniref:hypothetical protein n=1 Tax=Streptomyces roseolus TaxID=67358 RepID=UPI00167B201B|nr:hypothetical protein [Streptomyces roseolus]GGR66197.1 hypothetical protein GCM10010282_69050 [Streptomyces roseolus]
MAEQTHEPTMEIIRASLDPVSHRFRARLADLPTGRLILAEARKGAADQDAKRLMGLGVELARSASALTLELMTHDEKSSEEYLADMSRFAHEEGLEAARLVAEVANSMLHDQSSDGMETLTRAFAGDQADYLRFLSEIASCCGTSILYLKVKFDVPVEDSLDNLRKVLRNDNGASS